VNPTNQSRNDARRPAAGTPEDLGRLIAFAGRLVRGAALRRLEAAGESFFAWQILARLVHQGPSTQRELAAATIQHPAGVSRLLAEMEEAGLVRRGRDPGDRRKMVVEATPAGRQSFEANRLLVAGAVAEALEPLALREQRVLGALLRKLLEQSR
jgi:MarR family transcriptional regulator, lower aerobic nicotinate degradation pathway regulator